MTVTAAEMKEIERKAAEGGLSYEQMMENAGRAVADFVQEKQPVLRTAAIFVGKGNNGGDGLVAARYLRERGVRAAVILVEGEPKSEQARANFAKLDEKTPIWPIEELQMDQINWIFDADAAIDAVYGTGCPTWHAQRPPCCAVRSVWSLPSTCPAVSTRTPGNWLSVPRWPITPLRCMPKSRRTVWPRQTVV